MGDDTAQNIEIEMIKKRRREKTELSIVLIQSVCATKNTQYSWAIESHSSDSRVAEYRKLTSHKQSGRIIETFNLFWHVNES